MIFEEVSGVTKNELSLHFFFFPACGKAFMEYERDLLWPDLVNEYEGSSRMHLQFLTCCKVSP